MQRPYAYALRRATTAAALAATFVIAPLIGPTAAHANPRASSCANQEADCQSMAHSIARGTSSSKAKKVVCTSKNTARITLENGDEPPGYSNGYAVVT